MREYWSASQLKSMLGCEGQFKAKYIDEVPESGYSHHLAMGTLLDSALTKLVKMKLSYPDEDFLGEYIRNHILEAEKELVEIGVGEGEEWAAGGQVPNRDKIIMLVEKYWEENQDLDWIDSQLDIGEAGLVWGGVPVRGAIDAMYRMGDEIVIVDWKKKGSRLSKPDPMDRLQLSVYLEAARELMAMSAPLKNARLEIHVLVPTLKSPDYIVVPCKPYSKESIDSLIERRSELTQGAKPVLSPNYRYCGPSCGAWNTCIWGGAQ